MAYLTPPTPKIELYKDGFEAANDLLKRAETGKALSNLVERISEPMVIALDGGWGTGKSFFLKCWVGEHLKSDLPRAQTVYFDAFENDFIDSPLASLMGVIAEQLEDTNSGATFTEKTIKKMRSAALPLTRIGLAIASYGATEAGGALLDVFTKQASEELDKAAADFWSRESGTRAAMKQFREALIALTEPIEGSEDPQKLVIVIDELDRCRPDYALSLLEIIKHFFSVPHVHFVLGVNLEQLEDSVKARYGSGIDAGLYLQKFITVTMSLPDTPTNTLDKKHTVKYFEYMAIKMELNHQRMNLTSHLIRIFKDSKRASLRGVERLLTTLQLTDSPSSFGFDDEKRDALVIASLAIIKTWQPSTYEKAKSGTIQMNDLHAHFTMEERNETSRDVITCDLFDFWQYYLEPLAYVERFPDTRGRISPSKKERMSELHRLLSRHLDVFTLPEYA